MLTIRLLFSLITPYVNTYSLMQYCLYINVTASCIDRESLWQMFLVYIVYCFKYRRQIFSLIYFKKKKNKIYTTFFLCIFSVAKIDGSNLGSDFFLSASRICNFIKILNEINNT